MFTEKEIQLTREIFTQQKVSLMQPNAAELAALAQSVVKKMTEEIEQPNPVQSEISQSVDNDD